VWRAALVLITAGRTDDWTSAEAAATGNTCWTVRSSVWKFTEHHGKQFYTRNLSGYNFSRQQDNLE
jgi:hypothetical protein